MSSGLDTVAGASHVATDKMPTDSILAASKVTPQQKSRSLATSQWTTLKQEVSELQPTLGDIASQLEVSNLHLQQKLDKQHKVCDAQHKFIQSLQKVQAEIKTKIERLEVDRSKVECSLADGDQSLSEIKNVSLMKGEPTCDKQRLNMMVARDDKENC